MGLARFEDGAEAGSAARCGGRLKLRPTSERSWLALEPMQGGGGPGRTVVGQGKRLEGRSRSRRLARLAKLFG